MPGLLINLLVGLPKQPNSLMVFRIEKAAWFFYALLLNLADIIRKYL